MKKIGRALSYVLVGLCASLLTLFWVNGGFGSNKTGSKLEELEKRITTCFIEEVDPEELEDAAADAMVTATGDRWSYYIPASQYQTYLEQSRNAYVGVGITIQRAEDGSGLEIISVTDGGPAQEAGLQPGDVITAIEGTSCRDMETADARNLVRGEAGTKARFTVSRDGREQEYSVERRSIDTPVATYEKLDSGYGYIRIDNFESKCAKETIAAIDDLVSQGVKGLIFDVRYNPGGYKDELVKVLDHLLPEGVLFQSVNYKGEESQDTSDAACIKIPMAVLVNGDSYSAAEFFAAALQEYDWATVVGQQTCGKGYFQNTFPLSDGSAVALSVGKYFTPQGRSLIGVGVTPDVPVEVTEDQAKEIRAGTLDKNEDPQLQAAISALNSAQ